MWLSEGYEPHHKFYTDPKEGLSTSVPAQLGNYVKVNGPLDLLSPETQQNVHFLASFGEIAYIIKRLALTCSKRTKANVGRQSRLYSHGR